MPNEKPPRIPSYRLHKPTGLAVVRLNGRDICLGQHGTPASHEAYRRAVARWITDHHQRAAQGDSTTTATDRTVNELFLAYWSSAEGYYRKNGQPTSTLDCIRLAMRQLLNLYGTVPISEFGPLALKTVRDAMVQAGICRNSVNRFVGVIKRTFKWAVENELAPSSVWHRLQAVSGLRWGRSEAHETEPVRPAAEHVIHAVAPLLSRQVRAMIDLQLVTAMRPGEVTSMRGCGLDTTGKVWRYRPASHKTEHHGKQRLIHLGPRAQKIIKRWLRNDLTAYLFNPKDGEEERNAERREARKSPMTPSQAQRRRKAHPQRAPGARYTKDSYSRAIQRACAQAFPAPAGLPARCWRWTARRKRGSRVGTAAAGLNGASPAARFELP